METVQEFLQKFTEKSFVSATLSKERPFSPYSKITIRPVKLQDRTQYQVTYKTKTKDQVQNFDFDMLKINVHLWLIQYFYFGDLKTKKADIRLMQSKKGQATLQAKYANNKGKSTQHDRKKNRSLSDKAPFLTALGLASKAGHIHNHSQKKFKQINRYVELMRDLVAGDTVHQIIDMGSGKGYLTFALYDYLRASNPDIQVRGIELRQKLVDKSNDVAEEIGYEGLTFQQGSIDGTNVKKADLVIALHACDVATDMAIAKGVRAKSKYIAVAPCCHKQIRKAMKPTDSVLMPVVTHGILKERMAEMVTDTIRALLLESVGYTTKVFEFIQMDHTPKNVMITARYTGKKDKSALAKVEALKDEFGIDHHYLEGLL